MQGRKSPAVANILNRRFADRATWELAHAADDVKSMMAHPGWELVQSVLEEMHERLMRDLYERPPDDAAKLAKSLGFASALKGSADAAFTIVQAGDAASAWIAEQDEARSASG